MRESMGRLLFEGRMPSLRILEDHLAASLFFLPLSRWERGPGREVCGERGLRKEEGRRKKEETAITMILATSAMGLSQDSSGRGLLGRVENRWHAVSSPLSRLTSLRFRGRRGLVPPGARASCPRNAVVAFVGATLVVARLFAVPVFFVSFVSWCLCVS